MGECIISRRGGESYKLPVLDMNYPQDNFAIVNGEAPTFSVAIAEEGRPANYMYQWYRNGIPVENANSSIFVCTDINEQGVYSVYCEVTNKAGSVTSRIATFSVGTLPVLDAAYPKDATVPPSATASATFEARVATHGYPAEYEYQWYFDGVPVEGETSSTYTATGLSERTTHTVYCEVKNAVGTVTTRTSTLTVDDYYIVKNGIVNNAHGYSYGKTSYKNGYISAFDNDNKETAWFRVVTPIDLTNYTKLCVNAFIGDGYTTSFTINVRTDSATGYTAASATVNKTTLTTYTINISNLKGNHYLDMSCGSYEYNGWVYGIDMYIKDVYLC